MTGITFTVSSFTKCLFLTLKLCVVQSLDGIHGLIRVGHVYKSKILHNSTLCNCAILFKESTELVVSPLFYICYMQFD